MATGTAHARITVEPEKELAHRIWGKALVAVRKEQGDFWLINNTELEIISQLNPQLLRKKHGTWVATFSCSSSDLI